MTTAVRWFLLACVSAGTAPGYAQGGKKIATLRVTPESLTVNAGDIAQARCIPLTQRGDSLKNVCTWKSTDTTVVRVTTGSQTSTLTARRNGVVTVTASAGGRSASLKVTVAEAAPPPPPPPDTTPPPPPPTGCSGVAVAAGASLQGAVNANATGATFCLAPGTWAQQSVAPKAGQRFIGARDASGARLSVLDGQQVTVYAFTGAVAGVVVQGLVIKNYKPILSAGAIFAYNSTGWQILDNEITGNTPGAGTDVYTGWVIRRNWIHHNGQLGVTGQANSVGAVVDSNEIAFNNVGRVTDPNCCAGGVKVVKATGLILRGNYVHDNDGMGLWCDFCYTGTRYEGNRVEANTFIGIYHEASDSAVILGNTLKGNGAANRGGIWVDNSVHVEVGTNTLDEPTSGILLRQVSRSDTPLQLADVRVHDNTVKLNGAAYTGAVQYVGDNSYFTSHALRFTGNHYTLGAGSPFRWNNASLTWAQWQAAGQDPNGTVGP